MWRKWNILMFCVILENISTQNEIVEILHGFVAAKQEFAE